MTQVGNRLLNRTRVVGAAKLILPLTALALLSMVFLLAESVDPGRALETASIDVQDRARDPRLLGARFAGVTEDGGAIRIEAETARTDPAATLRFQVEGLALWLDQPGAGSVTARAQSGQIDRGRGDFHMEGEIRLTADPGYRLTASRIDGLLDRTRIEVAGPVTGQTPAGRIRAGNLTVSAPGPGTTRLHFRDGVHVLYPMP